MQQLLRQEAWAQAPVSDENQRRREDYIYQHYTVLPDTVPQGFMHWRKKSRRAPPLITTS